jgi:hypothetical protein
VLQNYKKVDQFGMQLCLKAAGLLNRMTKLFEETRSAVIFDIFSGDLLTFTWTWKDYGTGLLQADEAIRIAKLIFGFKGKLGPCGY